MNAWYNFLENEKLDPTMGRLPELCEAMEAPPRIRQHKHKLESRERLCNKAMDLGIDLTGIEDNRGQKCKMGRGLLDAWQKVYAARFGSTVGTLASKEVKRRDIKIRMPYKVRSKIDVDLPGDIQPVEERNDSL